MDMDREYQLAILAVTLAEFELHRGNHTEAEIYDLLIDANLSLAELEILDEAVSRIIEELL